MDEWREDMYIPEWLEEDPEYLLGGPDDREIEEWETNWPEY